MIQSEHEQQDTKQSTGVINLPGSGAGADAATGGFEAPGRAVACNNVRVVSHVGRWAALPHCDAPKVQHGRERGPRRAIDALIT